MGLALLATSCSGGGSDDRWTELATAATAPAISPLAWDPELGISMVPAADASGLWIESRIDASDWQPTAHPRLWRAPRRVAPEGFAADGSAEELIVGARSIPLQSEASQSNLAGGDLPEIGFVGLGAEIFLVLPHTAAPGEGVLRTFATRGFERDGRWRLSVGRFGADGLSVWPGERRELICDVPADSALSFTALRQDTVVPGDPPVSFSVTLDGEPLAEGEVLDGAPVFVRVPLPAAGRKGARLAFAFEGPPSITAFANPSLSPNDLGRHDARPWEGHRPDLVLFLADTLRRDALGATHEGESWTPNLDAFAAQGIHFERAWSPSSWTLPAQVSMMTALHPYQHGAVDKQGALPSELVTLAEALRAAGYRTGAVTDRGFVTRATNLDHGFEWFDEHWGTLEDTLAAAARFLDADDGRPVFLFVQSYHVHVPYDPSEATRAELGGRLDLPEFAPVENALIPEESYWIRRDPLTAERQAALTTYRDLYQATIVELDRAFGSFLDDLETRGMDTTATVLFTSDHGEAFHEHGVIGHGMGVWEELTGIPMVLRSPGVAARIERRAASLIDLPRTFAEVAGIQPDDAWLGRSLITLGEDRSTLSFECNNRGQASSIAVVEGDRKVIVPLEGWESALPTEAYDLAGDPGERTNAASDDWGARLLEAHRKAIEKALQPRASASNSALSAGGAENLRNLGYF